MSKNLLPAKPSDLFQKLSGEGERLLATHFPYRYSLYGSDFQPDTQPPTMPPMSDQKTTVGEIYVVIDVRIVMMCVIFVLTEGFSDFLLPRSAITVPPEHDFVNSSLCHIIKTKMLAKYSCSDILS